LVRADALESYISKRLWYTILTWLAYLDHELLVFFAEALGTHRGVCTRSRLAQDRKGYSS
jgi:hypothetical protein